MLFFFDPKILKMNKQKQKLQLRRWEVRVPNLVELVLLNWASNEFPPVLPQSTPERSIFHEQALLLHVHLNFLTFC